MQLELTTEAQKAIYKTRLQYPGWTQQKIADHLNVSNQLVSKVDRKRKVASLIQVPNLVKKKAYQTMEESADVYEMYITELEEKKRGKKTIIKQNPETGDYFKAEIDLEAMDIVAIIKEQVNIRSKLTELRTLDEPIKVLEWIGNHKLPEIIK